MTGRRLDIGIASYGNPAGLAACIASIKATTRTDWRLIIIQNPHPDPAMNAQVDQVIAHAWEAGYAGGKIVVVHMPTNVGYTGAVNEFLTRVDTPYALYCDHDVLIYTQGWDEQLAALLDREHRVGMVFPNGGPFPIPHDGWQEILWGIGCCWLLRREIWMDTCVGMFDGAIGHHEEVDYQTKVRLGGWLIASLPSITVAHTATASNDPASQERISRGVVNWVTKWERYFGGRDRSYHSQNVMRHELWPPSALYLERYWQLHLPGLNAAPEVVMIGGQEFDLIKVPRLARYYRHRII